MSQARLNCHDEGNRRYLVSPEARERQMTAKDVTDAHVYLQMYPGYSDTDLAIIAEFTNPDRRPEPGFVVDFLGSRIRTTSLWKEARNLNGQVLAPPVPGDFHAEAIEWIGLLK